MNLVFDAAALIALLRHEPGGPEVAELMGHHGGSASCVNLVEVVDRMARTTSVGIDDAVTAVESLIEGGLEAVRCDLPIALRAGVVRAEHYDKVTRSVSLADCVATATAELREATLVTSDAHLVDLANRIELGVHPIPNSAGTTPGAH